MKHIISILFLLIFAIGSYGQELPKSYEKKLKRQTRKVERMEKKYDVVLSPEESIPLPQVAVDALANKDWGLEYLNVTKYGPLIRAKEGKRKVLVVDFDTAGKFDHKSFDNCEIPGYDFTSEGLFDGHGHGTHVGGTISSENVNVGVGQVLAIDGYLKIMPVKILHNKGYGIMNEIIQGYKHVNSIVKDYTEAGWLVIYSNSWGGGGLDATLNKQFEIAESMGVIIVTASGNNGSGKIGSPSNSEFSESIGAIDKNGNRASFSQYGAGLTYVAPGVQIYSTWPNDLFAVLSGTSMATPHTTGVYALVASYWPDATPNEIKAHVRKFCTDLDPNGYDIFTGFGAPVIDNLLKNKPEKGGEPDDPIDDNPDDPAEDVIKEKRTVTVFFDSLDFVWGIGSLKDQRLLDVEFIIDVETNLLAEVIHDRFDTFSKKFLGNRGIMFTDKKADAYDACKWIIVFYEMFADRAEFNIDVVKIKGSDKYGREFILDGEGIGPKMEVKAEEMPVLFSRN